MGRSFIEELDNRFRNVKSYEMYSSPLIKEFYEEVKSNDNLLKEFIEDLNDYIDNGIEERDDDEEEGLSEQELKFDKINGNIAVLCEVPYGIYLVYPLAYDIISNKYFAPLKKNNRSIILFLYFYKRFKETYAPREKDINDELKKTIGGAIKTRNQIILDYFFLLSLYMLLESWLDHSEECIYLDDLNILNAKENPIIELFWNIFFERSFQRVIIQNNISHDIILNSFGNAIDGFEKGKNVVKNHPELLDKAYWEKPRRNPRILKEEIDNLLD